MGGLRGCFSLFRFPLLRSVLLSFTSFCCAVLSRCFALLNFASFRLLKNENIKTVLRRVPRIELQHNVTTISIITITNTTTANPAHANRNQENTFCKQHSETGLLKVEG